MTFPVIAIIGAGNMGTSLIGGLILNGHPASKIWATDSDETRLAQLQKKFAIQTTTDNMTALEKADVVIVAVKPQVFESVIRPLATVIQTRKPLLISIAAGVREATIQQWMGGTCPIVRTMPNTPALIGCGATALFANAFVTSEERSVAESILRAVGIIVWLDDEQLMDVVTALSGSGPAYFFLVMECLQQAAQQLGLPTDVAKLLTLQTGLGAVRMAIESGKPLEELRLQVTSPGGTTEKAISVLEDSNIRQMFNDALKAATTRSEELANMFGDKK